MDLPQTNEYYNNDCVCSWCKRSFKIKRGSLGSAMTLTNFLKGLLTHFRPRWGGRSFRSTLTNWTVPPTNENSVWSRPIPTYMKAAINNIWSVVWLALFPGQKTVPLCLTNTLPGKTCSPSYQQSITWYMRSLYNIPSPHLRPSLLPAVLRPLRLLPPAFLLAHLIPVLIQGSSIRWFNAENS